MKKVALQKNGFGSQYLAPLQNTDIFEDMV